MSDIIEHCDYAYHKQQLAFNPTHVNKGHESRIMSGGKRRVGNGGLVTYTHTHAYIHAHAHTHAHTHTCTHTHMHTLHMHTTTHAHKHTCTRTHTHTHRHTHTHTQHTGHKEPTHNGGDGATCTDQVMNSSTNSTVPHA